MIKFQIKSKFNHLKLNSNLEFQIENSANEKINNTFFKVSAEKERTSIKEQ